MKRFALTIELESNAVETFDDVVDVLGALIDRLKLFGAVRATPTGAPLRDSQERVVGSWEIREDS